MVPDSAVGVHSADTRAGINTLVVLAGLVRGTVTVDLTFRPAVGRGSKHSRSAGAVTSVANGSWRVGVPATGIGITGIFSNNGFYNLRLESAFGKWISNVTFITGAGWYVGPHLTSGIDATNTGTRVNTFIPLTGFVRGTVRVYHTFRSAGNIRIPKVFRDTLAGSSSLSVVTHSIGATW